MEWLMHAFSFLAVALTTIIVLLVLVFFKLSDIYTVLKDRISAD